MSWGAFSQGRLEDERVQRHAGAVTIWVIGLTVHEAVLRSRVFTDRAEAEKVLVEVARFCPSARMWQAVARIQVSTMVEVTTT